MDEVCARQNRIPITHMMVLSWLQMRYNEIYLVNESCLVQQRLSTICIALSWACVKLIRRLHGGFSLGFHVGEEIHATAFELKILMKLCHI